MTQFSLIKAKDVCLRIMLSLLEKMGFLGFPSISCPKTPKPPQTWCTLLKSKYVWLASTPSDSPKEIFPSVKL